MNLTFEGVIPPNATQTVLDETVPVLETWRLTLLTIRHQLDDPTPGTLVAKLWVNAGGEDRELMTLSGEDTFFRKPLYTVLEEGDRLTMEVTARHHDDNCIFDGYVSIERRSLGAGGELRVQVANTNLSGNYLHFQVPAATTWVIPHMLGRYPNVTTVDSLGREIEGEVTYLDPNTVRADFEVAVGGSAFCS